MRILITAKMIETLSEISLHLKPITPLIISAIVLELVFVLISIPTSGADDIDSN